MRNSVQRLLLTLVVVLAAGATGAVVSSLLGHVLALQQIDHVISVDANSAVVALGAFAGCISGMLWLVAYRRNGSVERQLRRAIAKDRLQVMYQPIVDLGSDTIVGAEALARWTDDEGTAIGPEVFVQAAEKEGFVGEITRLVVRHALRDLSEVIRQRPDFRLSVNIAAADLSDAEFLPMLDAALERSGVPRQNLVIELTETSAARGEMAVETIRRLRRAGHPVHIDDFGTGYSSLSYLNDLAVDAIKIDRSFTQAIGTESVTVAILPQILALAEALNLQVIAEGIENVRQAVYFSSASRPILGQGWFFGQAVPAGEFCRMLAARQNRQQVDLAVEETSFALPASAG